VHAAGEGFRAPDLPEFRLGDDHLVADSDRQVVQHGRRFARLVCLLLAIAVGLGRRLEGVAQHFTPGHHQGLR
jgi:hypothetical protein